MGNFIIYYWMVCIALQNKLPAQDDPGLVYTNMKDEIILKPAQMNEAQLAAWNTRFEPWLQEEFASQKKKLHYKQDCKQCSDIYFTTQLYIGPKGNVINYEIINRVIECDKKTKEQNLELEKAITKNFTTWVFPAVLSNCIIEARMGIVTKC